MITCQEYLQGHYRADFAVFGADSLCGANLVEILRPNLSGAFAGIAEFIVCQFELNLLNQAIYAHFREHHSAWRSFVAPFGNTLLCFSGHGLGSHAPDSILRFAQSPPPGSGARPVSFTRADVADYTHHFCTATCPTSPTFLAKSRLKREVDRSLVYRLRVSRDVADPDGLGIDPRDGPLAPAGRVEREGQCKAARVVR